MENWKPVVGYEGIYEVSDQGRIKRVRPYNSTIAGHILLSRRNRCGYSQISLSKNSSAKTKTIHRAVAEAFIPNPENKREVNHRDGNKENNLLSNLEWVTSSENQLHSYNYLGKKVPTGSVRSDSKFTQQDVRRIRMASELITQQEIANIFKTGQSHINMIVNRRIYKED